MKWWSVRVRIARDRHVSNSRTVAKVMERIFHALETTRLRHAGQMTPKCTRDAEPGVAASRMSMLAVFFCHSWLSCSRGCPQRLAIRKVAYVSAL